MSIKIKYLGLDFGSSVTTVVGFDTDGNPILFVPGDKPCFYSAIAKRFSSDEYVYFEEVFEKEKVADCSVYDDIKEAFISQKEIAVEFLKKVFTCVKETSVVKMLRNSSNENVRYDFSCLETVCYGFPEYADECSKEEYCKGMDEILPGILSEVFKKNDIKIISNGEPQLAALAYTHARGNTFKRDDLVLVLDFGGHTLDMALLKVGDRGALNSIRSQSSQLLETMGTGKKINRLIGRNVSAAPSNDRGKKNY